LGVNTQTTLDTSDYDNVFLDTAVPDTVGFYSCKSVGSKEKDMLYLEEEIQIILF
ncbi:MAG: hypothetical protein RLZ31_495, partial [Pseudomonadota bacterium]